jgi:hypothetical protein
MGRWSHGLRWQNREDTDHSMQVNLQSGSALTVDGE